MSKRAKLRTRLGSLLWITAVVALSYFYLFDYVQEFMNGGLMVSVFTGNPVDSIVGLYLAKAGFAMFSIAIVYSFKLIFPHVTTESEDVFEELVDETLAGGVLVFGFLTPLYEELVYRVVPYLLISGTFFLFGSTGIWHWVAVFITVSSTSSWVLAHGLRTPVIAPLGIFYGFMLWNGLLIEAFIIHCLYNSTLAVITKLS